MEKLRFPNQRSILIDKPKEFQNYAIYGKPEIGNASKQLTGNGFKVWCYLLSQSSGVRWALSPKACQNEWGIPKTSFYRGIDELIRRGYLDDYAIHISNGKFQFETNKNQNETEECQNEYSNNINNNINNNAHCICDTVRNTLKEVPIAKLRLMDIDGYNWQDHTENGIWTNPKGEKFKIIYD